MKTIINSIKENYKLVIGVLIAGMVLGWLLLPSSGNKKRSENQIENHEGHNHESEDPTTWTCSMHPQIKQDKLGLCPICAMDLIPLTSMQAEGDNIDPNEIALSESAAKLAEIQTLIVSKGTPQKEIYLFGKIQADERNIAVITARFDGRIEKLFVNYTGQKVKKGEKLATIYSPELVSAQKELLQALALKETRPSLYNSAVSKLKQWDLSDEQILSIKTQGEPQVNFEILSPITGTVTMRHVAIGDYTKQGETLLEVTDLSKVWVLFDAYENDLPWIKLRDEIKLSLNAIPGKEYSAKVTYIDPFLDAKTRVAKVRIELDNRKQELKPEMFANGILNSTIAEENSELLIPKTSILWTGKRAVVYVKVQERETPSFLYREITLGAEAGAYYVVAAGLNEGEEIVTNGVFKIDAASQLQGLPSMMNPDGGMAATGHDHGDMTNTAEMKNHEGHGGNHSSFTVAGNCEMCKENIETAALSVHGITSADWDAATQSIHLNMEDGVAVDKVHEAIAKVGYDTELMKADDDVYDALPGCCQFERLDYAKIAKPATENIMFKVAGNCDMCKSNIETAALSVQGVISANWEAETQSIHLNIKNGATIDKVHEAISKVGYDTELMKADDAVYNALPECCQFERLK